LHDQLAPYGIMQFVRSGRISISKTEMKISEKLKNF
jgi:acetolactate synthase-1/3 small subunit